VIQDGQDRIGCRIGQRSIRRPDTAHIHDPLALLGRGRATKRHETIRKRPVSLDAGIDGRPPLALARSDRLIHPRGRRQRPRIGWIKPDAHRPPLASARAFALIASYIRIPRSETHTETGRNEMVNGRCRELRCKSRLRITDKCCHSDMNRNRPDRCEHTARTHKAPPMLS